MRWDGQGDETSIALMNFASILVGDVGSAVCLSSCILYHAIPLPFPTYILIESIIKMR